MGEYILFDLKYNRKKDYVNSKQILQSLVDSNKVIYDKQNLKIATGSYDNSYINYSYNGSFDNLKSILEEIVKPTDYNSNSYIILINEYFGKEVGFIRYKERSDMVFLDEWVNRLDIPSNFERDKYDSFLSWCKLQTSL